MAGDATRHVIVRGLQVTDDAMYRRYREAMLPIFVRHGGSFGYDFVVSHVLASETDRPMNRVFTLCFGDRAHADAFFADPSYVVVRKALFDPSVAAATTISAYDEPVPDARAEP
jgi:uncharacterized protein (DUF1330 family)